MIDQHAVILAPPRVDPVRLPAVVENYAADHGGIRLDDLDDYLAEVVRLAPRVGLDPAVVVAQSAVETGDWTSRWWSSRLNPAGLGVTGDPDQNEASKTFASGTEAAQAQIVHLWLYTSFGEATPLAIRDLFRTDPRAFALIASGWAGTVRTLADLSGKWATDPRYGEKIADRFNAIFAGGNMPLNMTKGLIPMPPMIDHIVDVSKRCIGKGRGYDSLGPRRIDALYVHRSQGTWQSNINHFDAFCPGALTDLQIDHNDGRMMRFVRLGRPRESVNAPSGWANGAVTDAAGNLIAIGDALKLIQKHGGSGNAVNRFAESCEVTGFFGPNGDDPISDSTRDTIAQWFASRAHDYGITYEAFPMILDEDRSFIIGHRESRGGRPDDCPGDLLWSLIATPDADLIQRARAIMMEAQTGAGPIRPPKWAPKVRPPLRNSRPWLHVENGVVWHPVNGYRRTTKAVTPRQYADPNARPTRADLPAGTRVKIAYVVPGADGDLWYVGWGGSRMPAKAFV